MEAGVYFITGKLGSGKSAFAVSQIFEFLSRGRPVASNLDINFADRHFLHGFHNQYTRVPDKPKSTDLAALGAAYEGDYDEKKSGLIVLDECASWFNSRTWNDKDRQALIEWLIHARKKGWILFFLVQSFDVVDKQAREMIGEYVVHLYNSKKLPILRLLPFKWHIASIYYQMHGAETRVAIIHYRPQPYYDRYDTRQIFSGLYKLPNIKYELPPHLEGKSFPKIDWKLLLKTFPARLFLFGLCWLLNIKHPAKFFPLINQRTVTCPGSQGKTQ